MKLTIVAATGGIGRQLNEQAISAGHDVTAVARNLQNLSPAPARAVAADLASADPAALQPAVVGADAVLSALGPRTRADAGVAARGTTVITQAMRAAGVRRIIVVSAAPIGTIPSPGRPHPPRHDPGDGFIIRYLADPIVKRALREHYADLARMEDVLRASDLDWTAVRPPRHRLPLSHLLPGWAGRRGAPVPAGPRRSLLAVLLVGHQAGGSPDRSGHRAGPR